MNLDIEYIVLDSYDAKILARIRQNWDIFLYFATFIEIVPNYLFEFDTVRVQLGVCYSNYLQFATFSEITLTVL